MNEIAQVQDLVIFDGEQAVTDTRVLAKTFGKRHGNVLRAYDGLPCSVEFMRHNFVPHEFLDERGKAQRRVTMTKDGFSMLATGFTGPKAVVLIEAYIAAFNAMANQIAHQQQGLWRTWRR